MIQVFGRFSPQSCPRVTFLGPEPTQPVENVDPTRPAIADQKSDLDPILHPYV